MTVYRVQPAKSSDLTYPKVRPAFDENFIQTKTLDPVMTFSRSSGGTYVGPDGLIKIAGVNQPRFDHNPVTGECRGLLVEEGRTNLVNYSQDFSQSFWDKLYGTVVVSAATTAPDGSQTGFRAYQSGTGDYGYVTKYTGGGLSVTAGQTYTVSCFVKQVENGGLNSLRLTFDTSGQGGNPIPFSDTYFYFSSETFSITSGTSFQKFPNGWYRISYTATVSTSGTIEYGIVFDNNNSRGVYIWGYQLELGNLATSYIPTGASTITRAADRPIINRSINTSGTLFAEATTPSTSGTIASADNGTSAIAITLNNANTSRYALYYNTNRYLQISSNTSSIPTEVLQSQIPSGLNRVSLGYSELTSSSYINGYIRRFTYYSSPLSESNVKTLVGNTNNIYRDPVRSTVSSGLTLNLDAANSVSYPGSGTTWFDVSGSGNNGTLTNGPVYSSANGGSFVFDGINDWITLGNDKYKYQDNFTVETWARFPNLPNNPGSACGARHPIVYNNDYGYNILINYDGKAFWNLYSTNTNGIVVASLNSVVGQNYFHAVGIKSGTLCSFYVNGVLQGTANLAQNSMYYVGYPFGIGGGAICGPNTFYATGNIAVVNVYNRVLSETEVQQNFNALRGRYFI